jgi:acetyltransferase-like isoleucine patch superfamily enzyme
MDKQTFRQLWRRLFGKSNQHSYHRQQAKFRKRYPSYRLGAGTYGMPTVHDYKEGSTLHIGAYCSIAGGVQIFLGGHHRIDWLSSYPFPAFMPEVGHIENFTGSRGDVVIGSDVWLCANCTILSGVTIGHGAVIANSAVISRDVEPYAVMAGNPAQRVRWRFDEPTRQALLESAWWEWPEAEVRQVAGMLCSDNVAEFMAYSRARSEHLTGLSRNQ